MRSIKLIADHSYEVGDMVRTKTGKKCVLVDIGDIIFTSGSYIPTTHDHRRMNGTENFVIATCDEVTL